MAEVETHDKAPEPADDKSVDSGALPVDFKSPNRVIIEGMFGDHINQVSNQMEAFYVIHTGAAGAISQARNALGLHRTVAARLLDILVAMKPMNDAALRPKHRMARQITHECMQTLRLFDEPDTGWGRLSDLGDDDDDHSTIVALVTVVLSYLKAIDIIMTEASSTKERKAALEGFRSECPAPIAK